MLILTEFLGKSNMITWSTSKSSPLAARSVQTKVGQSPSSSLNFLRFSTLGSASKRWVNSLTNVWVHRESFIEGSKKYSRGRKNQKLSRTMLLGIWHEYRHLTLTVDLNLCHPDWDTHIGQWYVPSARHGYCMTLVQNEVYTHVRVSRNRDGYLR